MPNKYEASTPTLSYVPLCKYQFWNFMKLSKSFISNFSGDRIPQDLADEIVRVTPPKIQPGIKTKVNNLMREPGNKDLANSVLVDRVLAGSQGDIINAIKAVDRYKVF